MCMASKYVREFESITHRMEKDLKQLSKKLSEIDKLVADKYHVIELMNFNASEGYMLAKELQKILRQRRLIKDEIVRMRILQRDMDRRTLVESVCKVKSNLCKSRKHSDTYEKEWKYTYKVEEILRGHEQIREIH